jgi:hypothetical protein
VDFLISSLEEQAENFRPGSGKEIGERAHRLLFVNERLPQVNNKNRIHEKFQDF